MKDGGEDPLESKKGFGYDVRKARRKPSNIAIRDLLGNEISTEAFRIFGKYRREDYQGGGGP